MNPNTPLRPAQAPGGPLRGAGSMPSTSGVGLLTTPITTVMRQGPAQFDAVGQYLGRSLKDTPECISQGLALRLARHADRRLRAAGFGPALEGCRVEVFTMDADERPADRTYAVTFRNQQGGSLTVVRILTLHGWPTLDHGFAIDEG